MLIRKNFAGRNKIIASSHGFRGGLKEPETSFAEPVDTFTPSNPAPVKEYTFLAYLDGQNEMEGRTAWNMLKMEEAGSSQKMNVLVELGRASQKDKIEWLKEKGVEEAGDSHIDGDWSGVKRFYITRSEGASDLADWPKKDLKIHSQVLDERPGVDMSSSDEFADFLEWGMKTYPAKHYVVVMAGHGRGLKGILAGQDSDRVISIPELSKDLSDSVKINDGKKLDLLLFDSCNMHQAEVLSEIGSSVDYSIGSPNPVKSFNMPYNKILNHIEKGKNIEEIFFNIAEDLSAGDVSPAVSLVDMKEFSSVTESFKDFSRTILSSNKDEREVRKTFDEIMKGKERGFFVDISRVAEGFYKNRDKFQNPQIGEDAKILLQGLSTGIASISEGNEEKSGVSLFLPAGLRNIENIDERKMRLKFFKDQYGSLDLYRSSGWLDVVEKYISQK